MGRTPEKVPPALHEFSFSCSNQPWACTTPVQQNAGLASGHRRRAGKAGFTFVESVTTEWKPMAFEHIPNGCSGFQKVELWIETGTRVRGSRGSRWKKLKDPRQEVTVWTLLGHGGTREGNVSGEERQRGVFLRVGQVWTVSDHTSCWLSGAFMWQLISPILNNPWMALWVTWASSVWSF